MTGAGEVHKQRAERNVRPDTVALGKKAAWGGGGNGQSCLPPSSGLDNARFAFSHLGKPPYRVRGRRKLGLGGCRAHCGGKHDNTTAVIGSCLTSPTSP